MDGHLRIEALVPTSAHLRFREIADIQRSLPLCRRGLAPHDPLAGQVRLAVGFPPQHGIVLQLVGRQLRLGWGRRLQAQ